MHAADYCEEIVDRVGITRVAGLRENLNAVQFPAGFAERALVTASDDEVASFTRQSTSDGEADAAVGAGYEGEFPCQSTFF
jgi:hypothetical protein